MIDSPPLHVAEATSYCLTGRMADGTYTRPRSAASNSLPLGTKIHIKGSQTGPRGMRIYYIRDRIGYGTQLDLWASSCSTSRQFGRRTLRFKVVRRGR